MHLFGQRRLVTGLPTGALRPRRTPPAGGADPRDVTTYRVDNLLPATAQPAAFVEAGLPLAADALPTGRRLAVHVGGQPVAAQADALSSLGDGASNPRMAALRFVVPNLAAGATLTAEVSTRTDAAPAAPTYTRAQLAADQPQFGFRMRVADAATPTSFFYATLDAAGLTSAEHGAYAHSSPAAAVHLGRFADGPVAKGDRFLLRFWSGTSVFQGTNGPALLVDVTAWSADAFASPVTADRITLSAHLVTAWYQEVPAARDYSNVRCERRDAAGAWQPFATHQYARMPMGTLPQRGALFRFRLDGAAVDRVRCRPKIRHLRRDCRLLPEPNLESGRLDPTQAAQYCPSVAATLDLATHPWDHGKVAGYWGRTNFNTNDEGNVLVPCDLYALADDDGTGHLTARAVDATLRNSEVAFGLPDVRLDTGTGKLIRWSAAAFENNGDAAPGGGDYRDHPGWLQDLAHTTDPYWLAYVLTGRPHYLTALAGYATHAWHNATYAVPDIRNPAAVWQRGWLLGAGVVRAGVWGTNLLFDLLTVLPDGDLGPRLVGLHKSDVRGNWTYWQAHCCARLLDGGWTGTGNPSLGQTGCYECTQTRVNYGQSGFQSAWVALVMARFALAGALTADGTRFLTDFVAPRTVEPWALDGETVTNGAGGTFVWNCLRAGWKAYHPHCTPPDTNDWTDNGPAVVIKTWYGWAQYGRQEAAAFPSAYVTPFLNAPGPANLGSFDWNVSHLSHAICRESGSVFALHNAMRALGTVDTARVDKAVSLMLTALSTPGENGFGYTVTGTGAARAVTASGSNENSPQWMYAHGPVGASGGAAASAVLLEDAASTVLLEDGASQLLLG